MNRDYFLHRAQNMEPVFYKNHDVKEFETLKAFKIKEEEIIDAEERLKRFAPLVKKLFPETCDGIIESPLIEIKNTKKALQEYYGKEIKGRLFLKCDNNLKVAGSVKARGGIYEVLKHGEALALEHGLLKGTDNYEKLSGKEFKDFFGKYKIEVGSTGNLGLSIGIMSRALGFQAVVHMSKDAKAWKKELLRAKGVNVIEYESDYGIAVKEGRERSKNDKSSYFIDDENSKDLFLGYATAALRLKSQLIEKAIDLEKDELNLYLPCGVGGAPGGITFGAKTFLKKKVKCYFAEPTHAPCMLLGLLTGKEDVHVKDYFIDGITEADGLAVGSPSKLVLSFAKDYLDGEYTIEDEELFKLQYLLYENDGIKIEPSAAIALKGAVLLDEDKVHIAWATGGLLEPDNLFQKEVLRGRLITKRY